MVTGIIKVYECRTTEKNIVPDVVASKVYYTTDDKNLTEINLINTAISDAGVRATLYWFHDRGYVEEFLGHKKALLDHPTGLTLGDKIVWSKVAAEMGKLHKVEIPDLNQARYKEYGSNMYVYCYFHVLASILIIKPPLKDSL